MQLKLVCTEGTHRGVVSGGWVDTRSGHKAVCVDITPREVTVKCAAGSSSSVS